MNQHDDTTVPETWASQAEIFSNRLKKRHAHLRKWAKRTGVGCFRIYDGDIPEIPFQVDVYEKYLYIAEIVRFKSMNDEEHAAWSALMVNAAARTLGCDDSRVFVKHRTRQIRKTQYEKLSDSGHNIVIQEGGFSFEVNLEDYLDTGLFLDHRITRSMIRDLAMGAKTLNLFSYTGSFSVYAAGGGAMSTVSVDLSNTYTAWAQRNLALNGFLGSTHRCIAMDALEYLKRAGATKERFDLIVLDPPTFSNSKKMIATLDIQRDHGALIRSCMKILSSNGVLLFSNNYKRFKLDRDIQSEFRTDDITAKTIPEDFLRKRPHRSYLIQHLRR